MIRLGLKTPAAGGAAAEPRTRPRPVLAPRAPTERDWRWPIAVGVLLAATGLRCYVATRLPLVPDEA
ncbi:MAG TPA: hypothetical protein VMH39_13545, partial [Gemmatimonadaceae bacterium]|nr:hypothetical protein [Gemmatimonadaceae bacterium]